MSKQQERFTESYAQEEKLDIVLRLEFQRRVISSLTLLLQLSNGEKRIKELAAKIDETKKRIATNEKIYIGILGATGFYFGFFEFAVSVIFFSIAALALFVAMVASLNAQQSHNWALFNEAVHNQKQLVLELKNYTLYSFNLKDDYENNEVLASAELEIREDVLRKLKYFN